MSGFSCQRCKTPLRLDESLQSLNSASFDLLTGSKPAEKKTSSPVGASVPSERKALYDATRHNAGQALFQQGTPAARRGIGPGPGRPGQGLQPDMSFVVLTESQVRPPAQQASSLSRGTKDGTSSTLDIAHESLSHKLEAHNRLFEILSANSEIDHPVCLDCSEILLSQFQARLVAVTKERDAYVSFLKDLKSHAPTAEDVAKAQQDLVTAQADEEKAFQDLLAKESEKEELEKELAELDEEERKLQKEEETFWRSRNSLDQELSQLQLTKDALTAAYEHDEAQLERLRRTNVYNDTFSVGHDGSFGTINGLRLGRLPPPNHVEWAEINAAWGLAALLLVTVAEKLGFVFLGYRIRPMGSTTKIERIEKPQGDGKARTTNLDLFSSGDLPLAKGILHRKFNEAMVAFLQCVVQLERFVGNDPMGQKNFALMYPIVKDTIKGISIRLGHSSDEQWTQACKFLLTNCKLLLAHTSSLESGRNG